MKKIFISIFLCLISLTLISCDKKTTTTKTSPISSSTNTTKTTSQTVKPTTTLSNDELTSNYYKEMVKKAKANKSSVAYYTFNIDSIDAVATLGIDLSEQNSGKLLFNVKLNKEKSLNPEVSVVLSLKNLENSETEDFLFVSVSKDVFASIKIEKDALDKDQYLASEEYAELKDVKYAVNMTSILNLKITDYVDVNLGSASSLLSTTIRGLLATILLNSNRTIGASVTNLIRTFTLLGVMDSNGKIDLDKSSEMVKTIIYLVKQKEFEGQPKKLLTLRADIDDMVDPIVKDVKERISTIQVVDDESKTEFGYEFEITNVKVLLDFFNINFNIDSKVSAKLVFTQTKATGGSNNVEFYISAGAIKLFSVNVQSSLFTDVVFDMDINNYTVVDFSEVKALLDTFKQE